MAFRKIKFRSKNAEQDLAMRLKLKKRGAKSLPLFIGGS